MDDRFNVSLNQSDNLSIDLKSDELNIDLDSMIQTEELDVSLQDEETFNVNLQNEENLNVKLLEGIPVAMDDYNPLRNKPKIEGVTLEGDKTYEELNMNRLTNIELENILQ